MPGFGAMDIKPDPDGTQGMEGQLTFPVLVKQEINENGIKRDNDAQENCFDANTEGVMPGCSHSQGTSQQAGGTILLSSIPHNGQIMPSTSASVVGEKSGSAKQAFHVDTDRIRAIPESQQNDDLQGLGLRVYNQDEFEEDVIAQVDEVIAAEKKEQMERMLKTELKSVDDDLRSIKQELENMNKIIGQITPMISKGNKEAMKKLDAIKSSREKKLKQLKKLKAKQKSVRMKLHGQTPQEGDDMDADDAVTDTAALEEALGLAASVRETERERLIRTGEMTPFGSVTAEKPVPKVVRPDEANQMSDFEKYLTDQTKKIKSHNKWKKTVKKGSTEENTGSKKTNDVSEGEPKAKKSKRAKSNSSPPNVEISPTKGKNLFDAKDKRRYRPNETDFSNWRGKKMRFPQLEHNFTEDGAMSDHEDYDDSGYNEEDRERIPDERYVLDEEDMTEDQVGVSPKKGKSKKTPGRVKVKKMDSDYEYEDLGSDEEEATTSGRSGTGKKKKSLPATHGRDDGTYKAYETRIKEWKRNKLKRKHARIMAAENGEDVESSEDSGDEELDGGFKVPCRIWNKLYKYQRTGVKWLWELHCQQAGGIVGDEMGLGKTIQIISFLAGLKRSRLKDKGAIVSYYGMGPTLIVCPATIMHQWIKEFHTWAPLFRVAVLHSSGSYTCSPDHLVREIYESHGVLITAYSGVLIYQDILLEYDWHYVILDEGHKIRNPDAQITVASKKFRTCHRLILSGSPVQNNLKELWSLFDFVFPGKLGTLPDFMTHFSVPIVQGGYSNATQIQVQTAYKCACVLRDTINPYLLRRMKADVKLQLPSRNEQVLFCRLTEEQKDVYKEYLDSKECNMILSGKFMVFPGLITLRKICNHPDLATGGLQVSEGRMGEWSAEEREYGYWRRAGKMQVIHSLLKLWHKQGHRVLLFTQSRQMLDIMETYIQRQEYTYMRMDGATTISARQPLINQFNTDQNIFVFLLTTRVGGLGVNLTGANRIIIYDPDWNPSTDTQARERAWRIGQTRPVTIYRLLTAGSIEEKIYHRQIFKQFLTNRVLKDPKQRRFFKSSDMYELFTLTDDDPKNSTETSALFAGTGSDVTVKLKTKDQAEPRVSVAKGKKKKKPKKINVFDKLRAEKELEDQEEEIAKEEEEEDNEFGLPPEKLKELREMARKLSQQIGNDEEPGGSNVKQNDGKDDSPDATDTKTANNKSDDPVEISDDDSKTKEGDPLVISDDDSKTKGDSVVISDDDESKTKGDSVVISDDDSKAKDGDKDEQNCDTKPKAGPSAFEKELLKSAEKSKPKSKHKHSSSKSESKSKKDKKKKKKKKDAKVDGSRIAYLAKNSVYKSSIEKPEDSANLDDYVLKQLFKKSGVHSAIQHDKIMDSATPDYALVEAEADRVATQAAKALKQSRSLCNPARSGIPTWTGQSGGLIGSSRPRFGQKKNSKLAAPSATVTSATANKVKNEEKKEKEEQEQRPSLFDGSVAGNVKVNEKKSASDILSSSELLARMRSRNHALLNSKDGDETRHPNDLRPEELDLFTDIRNHISFACTIDGQATTNEVLDQFRSRIPAHNSAQFKAMLSQLCDFHKIHGQGTWVLKPEFR